MFLQQLVTGISVGGIYALLATGYSLIYSLLDFSNWAHGEFAMVSAYIAIVLSSFMGMPFVLAAVGGMAGGALVSFLCERFAYRRIRRNGAPNMFLMIAAMGLSNVFQQAANLIFSGQYRSYPFKLPVSTIKVASAYIGVLDLVSLAITAVIITILVYLINKTQFGLNVRAIACNAHAAKVLGVKVDRCIATVFVLAGALAGVAGVLYGMKYNVFPTMGNVGLKAFIASVIGGLGSVPGFIAFLLGSITLRLKGDYFLITCLGFGECVRVLFNYTKNITGGSAGFPGIPAYSNALFSVLCVVLAFFVAWRFIHSKYGRNLTSIRENEMAAEAVGINAYRVKRMSFVFSAIYAGWAGALYGGYLMYIVPSSFNLAKSCELITTTVIGGLGSLTGSLLGAVIVTVLPEVFRSLANYRMLLYGIAVVLIILFKPSGLYGYKEFSLKRTIRWFRTLPERQKGRKQAKTEEKEGR